MPQNDGKRWLFDHWNYIDPDEADWREAICQFYGIKDSEFDDLTDEQKYACLSEYEENDYEDEKSNIQAVVGDDKILCVGSAQVWNGTLEGGYIAENVQDAIDQLRGRDYGDIGWYEDTEEGQLHMTFTHHDGTNDVIMYRLTSDGWDFAYENEYNYDDPLSDRDLHKALIENPNYTEAIDVYGNLSQ